MAVAFGLRKLFLRKKPKAKKLKLKAGAFELFSRLHQKHEACFLFESAEPDKELGRFSYLGFAPAAKLTVSRNFIRVEPAGGGVQEFDCKKPFEELRAFSKLCSQSAGGLVGHVNFEATKCFDSAAVAANSRGLGFPVAEFSVYLDGAKFDSLGNCVYSTLGVDRSEEIERVASGHFERPVSRSFSISQPNLGDAKFEAAVDAAKEYVRAGDAFQIVLSRRRGVELSGSKLPFYGALRELNPSPYMYFLKSGKREIIGSSPEMLVRVEKKVVETFPIAGTRKRGATAREDEALEKELRASEKERAEHLMLVDLARNDVGRVSAFGSVKVSEFMKVKKFSHVQHLVSRVRGKLATGLDCFDAFESVFPAGTVSGAPKLRAMEIISELEKCGRGPYAGGVGYFSFSGDCNFAIAIRTLFSNGKKSFLQAGAGIVFDSDAEFERKETDSKAMAVVAALEAAKKEGQRGSGF